MQVVLLLSETAKVTLVARKLEGCTLVLFVSLTPSKRDKEHDAGCAASSSDGLSHTGPLCSNKVRGVYSCAACVPHPSKERRGSRDAGCAASAGDG
jgi:hypothetical protein